MNSYDIGSFRWLVIDGNGQGPDNNGGELVCINGSGNSPLFTLTIDQSGGACSFEATAGPVVPTTPIVDVPGFVAHPTPISPVPEPSTLALMLVAFSVAAWWLRFSARSAQIE